MIFSLMADLVVLLHLLFILYAVFGALLVFRWKRNAWLHLPALMWAVLVALNNWVCPLTPVENRLRAAGAGTYTGGFIEHYIIPVIYPAPLTPVIQTGLGIVLLVFNAVVYGIWAVSWLGHRRGPH